MNVHDMFAELSSLLVEGMMIHSQLADFYLFLGADHMANIHEDYLLDDTCLWRNIVRYHITHFGSLVPEDRIDTPHIIPDGWYTATVDDVDDETRERAMTFGKSTWIEWASRVQEKCADYYRTLVDDDDGATAMRIKKCLCEIEDELSDAERI